MTFLFPQQCNVAHICYFTVYMHQGYRHGLAGSSAQGLTRVQWRHQLELSCSIICHLGVLFQAYWLLAELIFLRLKLQLLALVCPLFRVCRPFLVM